MIDRTGADIYNFYPVKYQVEGSAWLQLNPAADMKIIAVWKIRSLK